MINRFLCPDGALPIQTVTGQAHGPAPSGGNGLQTFLRCVISATALRGSMLKGAAYQDAGVGRFRSVEQPTVWENSRMASPGGAMTERDLAERDESSIGVCLAALGIILIFIFIVLSAP